MEKHNTLRRKLESGTGPAFGAWLTMGGLEPARILATVPGLDVIFFPSLLSFFC
jgi:hypothetical protein